ncbi:E2F-associated phosphoprotein [Planoprotostelium fungivorum]|uniref:E2F-associated phosphoprotein n=1 Tax=Planoprotostelium fungivorum TaxID=1890364 RepID=A0A2P6MW64_9EUKA|nr:E2F-associated phosphoprotein [Planoprotostelium fungivorum]
MEETPKSEYFKHLESESMWMDESDHWLDYHSSSEEDDSSDEEDGQFTTAKKEKKEKATDEDPLYNDKADDKDSKWMNKWTSHMGGRRSDAVLNCACCFMLLCVDCQQHSIYLNQFRAMFVRNCAANKQKEIRYRKPPKPKLSKTQQKKMEMKQKRMEAKAKKRGEQMIKEELQEIKLEEVKMEEEQHDQEPYQFTDRIMEEDSGEYEKEVYLLVYCNGCQAEVGVMDDDQVYHLYNVIPSDPL